MLRARHIGCTPNLIDKTHAASPPLTQSQPSIIKAIINRAMIGSSSFAVNVSIAIGPISIRNATASLSEKDNLPPRTMTDLIAHNAAAISATGIPKNHPNIGKFVNSGLLDRCRGLA